MLRRTPVPAVGHCGLFGLIVLATVVWPRSCALADAGNDWTSDRRDRPCCLANASPEQIALFVHTDPSHGPDSVRFIHFRIDTNIDMGKPSLEILWDLPDGIWIYDPVFRLALNGERLDVRDRIVRDAVDANLFSVALAGIAPGGSVLFSMGWRGADFEASEASILFHRGAGKISFYGGWQP